MILQASTWNAVRRSRRASKKGETPCPVMPDKRKILCQDNSKSDTNSPCCLEHCNITQSIFRPASRRGRRRIDTKGGAPGGGDKKGLGETLIPTCGRWGIFSLGSLAP